MIGKLFNINFKKRLITTLFGIAGFLVLFYLTPPIVFSIVLVLLGLWIALQEWPLLCSFSNPPCAALFLFYPIPSFVIAIILNQSPLTHPLFGWMIITVNLHDSAAYVAGTLFGKHKIAPTVSPKKSLEGLFGGFLALFIAHFFIIARKGTSVADILMISWIVSVLATLGDFFESYLKRRAGVKDSGSLLPGHGGLLDRFDALIFVTPFVYLWQNNLFDVINCALFM